MVTDLIACGIDHVHVLHFAINQTANDNLEHSLCIDFL